MRSGAHRPLPVAVPGRDDLAGGRWTLVFLLYQKGRDSRIFQAQDARDRRFHVERKTKERQYWQILIYVLIIAISSVAIRLCADMSRVRPVSTPLPTTSLALIPQASCSS